MDGTGEGGIIRNRIKNTKTKEASRVRGGNTNGDGCISLQGLEHIAFEGDAPTVVQHLGSARDLRRVELLVLVRGQRGIHVRDESRNRQRVGGGVGRAEEVPNRVAREIQPFVSSAATPKETRKYVYGKEDIESGKENKKIPTQKAIAMHKKGIKVAGTMTGGARYAEIET